MKFLQICVAVVTVVLFKQKSLTQQRQSDMEDMQQAMKANYNREMYGMWWNIKPIVRLRLALIEICTSQVDLLCCCCCIFAQSLQFSAFRPKLCQHCRCQPCKQPCKCLKVQWQVSFIFVLAIVIFISALCSIEINFIRV